MGSRIWAAALGLLLLGRFLLAFGFATQIPLWERYDELNHYRYAWFIAHEGRLPTKADMPSDLPLGWEFFVQYEQPPLYYLMITPVVSLFDRGDSPDPYPNARPECPISFTHYFIHTEAESFPWEGMTLAAWLARLITILLGVAAVGMVWLIVRQLWPNEPWLALGAAGIFAFAPTTIEMTLWLNNDSPLLFFGALTLYWMLRARQNPTNPRLWLFALLSATLCAITKLNGAVMLLLVGLLFMWQMLKSRLSPRQIMLLISLSLLGFWLSFVAFNMWRCDQLLCRVHRTENHITSPSVLWHTLTRDFYADAFEQFSRTALIPWLLHEYSPAPLMVGAAILIYGIGLLGAGLYGRAESAKRPLLGVLLLIPLGAFTLAILRVWWLQTPYMPFRYVAVSMPALAILIALGWFYLLRRFNPALILIPVLGLALLSALTPILNYRPIQTPPPRYSALPSEAIPIEDYHFESGITLLAYEALAPTELGYPFILYWGTEQPIDKPMFTYLMGLDADNQAINYCGLTTGSPLWSTLEWQPGEIVPQTFVLPDLEGVTSLVALNYYLDDRYYLITLPRPDWPDNAINAEVFPARPTSNLE